jgi:hypothetical protein
LAPTPNDSWISGQSSTIRKLNLGDLSIFINGSVSGSPMMGYYIWQLCELCGTGGAAFSFAFESERMETEPFFFSWGLVFLVVCKSGAVYVFNNLIFMFGSLASFRTVNFFMIRTVKWYRCDVLGNPSFFTYRYRS